MARIDELHVVTIVVPIYKETLAVNEAASLRQLKTVLGTHPIVFITYTGLDTREYIGIIPEARFEFFDYSYFSSVEGYSRLLLQRDFYLRLATSRYILIYQTDAWVFSDQLNQWCRAGFDYVGAPWFDSHDPKAQSPATSVGNGGFSLRRVDKILRWYVIAERTALLKKTKADGGIALALLRYPFLLKQLLARDGNFDIVSQLFPDREPVFEDLFWCGETWEELKDAIRDLGMIYFLFFPWLYWRLRTPTPRRASRFAFEVRPSYLFQINRHSLPFGCHAWEKWEPEFWRNHIK